MKKCFRNNSKTCDITRGKGKNNLREGRSFSVRCRKDNPSPRHERNILTKTSLVCIITNIQEISAVYDVRVCHFRDIYGKFLWAEPAQEDFRIYRPGEDFELDDVRYKVERVAIAENTQHINISVIHEDENIVEPYL